MTRQATARFTDRLSGWMRSALPGVVIDAPDEERGRRGRVVDATIYLLAFAIGAGTLADTWELHPPWLRVVAIVVGIAAIVALRWRRTHPGVVGIGVMAVAIVIVTVGARPSSPPSTRRSGLAVVTWPSSPASRSPGPSRARCSIPPTTATGSTPGPACWWSAS